MRNVNWKYIFASAILLSRFILTMRNVNIGFQVSNGDLYFSFILTMRNVNRNRGACYSWC